MKLNTRKFGEISIDEDKILFMPEGLPGFLEFKHFVLIEDPKSAPFCWYQSTEDPNLALVVMSPFVFKPDYKIDLEGFLATRSWDEVTVEQLLIYVVINVLTDQGGKKITANLMGPIIINPQSNEAFQLVIPDSSYSHKHDVLSAASA